MRDWACLGGHRFVSLPFEAVDSFSVELSVFLLIFFFFYHLLGLSPTSKLLHISWAGSLRKWVTVYTIQIPREWTKKAENFQFQRGVSYTPFGGLLGWMKMFETESLVLWFFYISSFSCCLYELLCWLPRWNSNSRKERVKLRVQGTQFTAAGGSCSHCGHGQEAESGTPCSSASLPSSVLSRTPAQGMAFPMFRAGLSTSANLASKVPPRLVGPVNLTPFKWTNHQMTSTQPRSESLI